MMKLNSTLPNAKQLSARPFTPVLAGANPAGNATFGSPMQSSSSDQVLNLDLPSARLGANAIFVNWLTVFVLAVMLIDGRKQ